MTMRRRVCVLTAVLGLCLFGASGHGRAGGKEGPMVGDKAPAFEAQDDQDKTWKSSDYVGKKIIVVYFYPADFTGGCTKQACGFRDDLDKLTGKNVIVVGISGDTAKTHKLFKKAEKLNFTLLADEKGDVAKKFGVPVNKGGKVTKEIDGEKIDLIRGVSIARWTFVIDLKGNIAHRDTKVNAADDSKKIQEVIKNLASN